MIKFTKWMKWEDRKRFEQKKYPGIYMISITDKNLDGKNVDYKDVDYIGMTNSKKGLSGRWYQLNNSINGKKGHSGGNTIYEALGD